jgi:hypothetical protein
MVQDPNKAMFLKDVMRDQMSEVPAKAAHKYGYLWLAFLEVDGVKAAASLNFDYKNKLWGYNSGVSREHMELSPGWVLLGHVIQWCCENGRREFDFMRGDEEYKYRFGGVNKYVMRARVNRALSEVGTRHRRVPTGSVIACLPPPPLTPADNPPSVNLRRSLNADSISRVSRVGLRRGVSTRPRSPFRLPVL